MCYGCKLHELNGAHCSLDSHYLARFVMFSVCQVHERQDTKEADILTKGTIFFTLDIKVVECEQIQVEIF